MLLKIWLLDYFHSRLTEKKQQLGFGENTLTMQHVMSQYNKHLWTVSYQRRSEDNIYKKNEKMSLLFFWLRRTQVIAVIKEK